MNTFCWHWGMWIENCATFCCCKLYSHVVVPLIVCRDILAWGGGSSHWAKDRSLMLVVVLNVEKSFRFSAWQLLMCTAGSNAMCMNCVGVCQSLVLFQAAH